MEYMFEEHFAAQFPEDTRKEEIEKIISYVQNGNSCQLVGIPGVNRSTVLGLLIYNKAHPAKTSWQFSGEKSFCPYRFFRNS